MRVLFLNDYEHGGGAERVVELERRILVERGHEIEAVFGASDAGTKPRSLLAYINSRQHRKRVAAAIDTFKPDIVHAHNIYHLLSPAVLDEVRNHGVRLVLTAHDQHLICPSPGGVRFDWMGGGTHAASLARCRSLAGVLATRWDLSPARSIARVLQHVISYRVRNLRNALSCVICPGLPVATRIASMIDRPVVRLPNLAPAAFDPGTRSVEGPLRFVFVGRVEPEKGVVEFARAIGSRDDIELRVVGDGSLLPQLTSATRLGRLDPDAAAREIAASHVLVLPAMTDENDPLVLAEAVACGTNVLVTDRGGMRAFLDETGIGFAFRFDEPGSLDRAIEQIRAARAAGELNSFDAAAALAHRTESAHAEALESIYRGEIPPDLVVTP
ncbi:MAG: glycosyltransferase [Planctomycetota bacterium]